MRRKAREVEDEIPLVARVEGRALALSQADRRVPIATRTPFALIVLSISTALRAQLKRKDPGTYTATTSAGSSSAHHATENDKIDAHPKESSHIRRPSYTTTPHSYLPVSPGQQASIC